jgi:predicted nuclease of predicted toxin-antitoxin system
MWLLDVNLPKGLLRKLKALGIEADTTAARGWRDLGNGALAQVAHTSGFRAILTRDRLFGESAAKALKTYPDLAVVILRLPQSREDTYLREFENQWRAEPIRPVPGVVIEWP